MGFVANFIGFSAVQKFWKSVKIWRNYRQFIGGNFFLRHIVHTHTIDHMGALPSDSRYRLALALTMWLPNLVLDSPVTISTNKAWFFALCGSLFSSDCILCIRLEYMWRLSKNLIISIIKGRYDKHAYLRFCTDTDAVSIWENLAHEWTDRLSINNNNKDCPWRKIIWMIITLFVYLLIVVEDPELIQTTCACAAAATVMEYVFIFVWQ